MNSETIKYIGFSFFIILIQILFLNNMNFLGFFNPKLYAVIFLFLPRNIKPVPMMTIGLIVGLIVDSFSMTMGLGMASSVLICFLRPYLFRLFYNKRDDDDFEFDWDNMEVNFIIRYLFISLFAFHLIYFFIELGEAFNIFYILLKSLLSASMALFLFLLGYFLFAPSKNNKAKNERRI